jgi:hypothetical protein
MEYISTPSAYNRGIGNIFHISSYLRNIYTILVCEISHYKQVTKINIPKLLINCCPLRNVPRLKTKNKIFPELFFLKKYFPIFFFLQNCFVQKYFFPILFFTAELSNFLGSYTKFKNIFLSNFFFFNFVFVIFCPPKVIGLVLQ